MVCTDLCLFSVLYLYLTHLKVTPIYWQLPLWEHLLRWMEEQPETWRRHNEVDEPPTAVCGHVAEWSPGFTESRAYFISLLCQIMPRPIDFYPSHMFVMNLRLSLFVQHGRGTYFWNISQGDGLHFFLNSYYTGEFAQGQRHGKGRICFASGASYDGEWKNNESHSKVQF